MPKKVITLENLIEIVENTSNGDWFEYEDYTDWAKRNTRELQYLTTAAVLYLNTRLILEKK